MGAVKTFLYILFLLFIAVVALIFSFRNDSVVAIDLIFFQSSSLSIGFWIVASFIVGSALGWLMALPGWVSLKLSHSKRDRQLKSKEHEISKLKGDSVK